jgi:hypothetical protein
MERQTTPKRKTTRGASLIKKINIDLKIDPKGGKGGSGQ